MNDNTNTIDHGFDSWQSAAEILNKGDRQKSDDPRLQAMQDNMVKKLSGFAVPPECVYRCTLEEMALRNVFAKQMAVTKEYRDVSHRTDHRKELERELTGRGGEMANEVALSRAFCDYRIGNDSRRFGYPDLWPLLPVGVKTIQYPSPWLIEKKYAEAKEFIDSHEGTLRDFVWKTNGGRPLYPQIMMMVSSNDARDTVVTFGLVPVSVLMEHADPDLVINPQAKDRKNGKFGFNAFEEAIPFYDWKSLVRAFNSAVEIDKAAGVDLYSCLMNSKKRAEAIEKHPSYFFGDPNEAPIPIPGSDPNQPWLNQEYLDRNMPKEILAAADRLAAHWESKKGVHRGVTAVSEHNRLIKQSEAIDRFIACLKKCRSEGIDPLANLNTQNHDAKAAVDALYDVYRYADFGRFPDAITAIQAKSPQTARYLVPDRVMRIEKQFADRELREADARRASLGRSTVAEHLADLQKQAPDLFNPSPERRRAEAHLIDDCIQEAEGRYDLADSEEPYSLEDWLNEEFSR